jgi:phospholipid/cholesterol/gamma-HCH transport system permease protein
LIARTLHLLETTGQLVWPYGRSLGDLAYRLANALSGLGDLAGPRGFYIRRTIVQQVYFTAVQAFWLINVIGIALGVLIILPMLNFGVSDVELQATVMKLALFHQLAPFLTALVVIGRSGTALTAEMGEFQYSGVIDSLLMMGIDPDRFLVLPRLIGVTVSLLLLTLWANLAALFGAGAYNALVGAASLDNFIRACAAVIDPIDTLLTLLMVLAYGMTIALVQCGFGLRSRNVVELQRNLPKAFVQALLLCVGITVLFMLVRT